MDSSQISEKLIRVLKNISFFSGLTAIEISSFLQSSSVVEQQKSNSIFEYGQKANKFFVIIEGWVKLYRLNKDGEETVISLLTAGDSFGETACFEDSEYPYSSQVVDGTAKILAIPAKIIRQRITEQPDIALKMLTSLSKHMEQLSLSFEHLTKLTTAQRLGCFLLKLSIDNKHSKTLSLPYKKNLIASRLVMQPETYSRAVKRLGKDLKIKFKGRSVTIPDLNALYDYCEVYCFNDDLCSLEQKLCCNNAQCDISRIIKFM